MSFIIIDYILLPILTLIPLIISIAFFTLAERKIMASIQRRKGPNLVGFWGILQPFADGFKLILKELIFPTKVNTYAFIGAPALVLFFSLISWILIPFNVYTILIEMQYSILFFLIISSFGVYGIFLAGWSSNSKYALLGGVRAIAQMVSYEITISLSILPIIAITGSLNIITIVNQQIQLWFILPFLPLSIIFFISILAETNRTPFDLAEAEAELVAGYNIEYSSFIFAAFFLGEYSNILLMSVLFVSFFLGGWLFNYALLSPIIFSLKIVFISFLFVFIRSNLPRYRFDQLMIIGWKVFLPVTFGFMIFYTGIILSLNFSWIHHLPHLNYEFIFISFI